MRGRGARVVGEDGYVRGRMEGVERKQSGRGERQRRYEKREAKGQRWCAGAGERRG